MNTTLGKFIIPHMSSIFCIIKHVYKRPQPLFAIVPHKVIFADSFSVVSIQFKHMIVSDGSCPHIITIIRRRGYFVTQIIILMIGHIFRETVEIFHGIFIIDGPESQHCVSIPDALLAKHTLDPGEVLEVHPEVNVVVPGQHVVHHVGTSERGARHHVTHVVRVQLGHQ